MARSGVLLVTADRNAGAAVPGSDLHLCLTAEGEVFAFHGHVDLGTGIRTALAQIVAEELDVPLSTVTMRLGDTSHVPDQGPTIASETIQVRARPLRAAAAQARVELVRLAAAALGVAEADLDIVDGLVSARADPAVSIPYADLLANRRVVLALDLSAPVKPVADYRIVGRPVGRVDLPEKAIGAFTYVHDVRLPGMLHGRVVRPPYAGVDHGPFIGTSLLAVERDSVADVPGLVAVVVEGDFIGVVAEREEQAAFAAERLVVRWKGWQAELDPRSVETALRANPSTPRRLVERGDVEAALAAAPDRIDRTYVWPYQMHGSIGPSCAVADFSGGRLRVWSGTQNPFWMRADLARLTGLAEAVIDVVRLEAAGCYGRNGADDVTADAALLSRAVGRPVRVQLTREQEHLWEPKGAGQLIDVSGALGDDATLSAYAMTTRYPSNLAPTLALLLTGAVPPDAVASRMGDRSALPPYDYENLRVTVEDMAPIARASWLRGVSAMPNVFAHESFIDELAEAAGVDPVAFRLRHLTDPRAAELVRATAKRAGWEARSARDGTGEGPILSGRGFAQARYLHGDWPGVGAAWSAWVADVAVNRDTGEIAVTRVVVGQDTGLMVNPAGVRHQIHGNVVQSISRVLKEEVTFSETTAVANRDWGSYPILNFAELPAIDVLMLDRQDHPPLGAGESASVPSAAAIVNAVYDATGVRFTELPLTPERVLAGLGRPVAPAPHAVRPRRRWIAPLGAFLLGALSFAAVGLAVRPSIAPIARPDPAAFAEATIARGRALMAIGDCAICHTAPGGNRNAGGRALETPFGPVVSTNITPDVATGIGAWSYPAFERAMRDGVARDGRHLYPAFPYPHFALADDADLQAVYAALMAEPAVVQANPPSRLVFPANLRPLMAAWNALFARPAQRAPDPARSSEWNRGRYLVDGLGHCGACHTPRNLAGAPKGGAAYLAGGVVDGWEAPALGVAAASPLPWLEGDLYDYLRTGISARHGVAAGPMAEVVESLRDAPDADLRAMAAYLAAPGSANAAEPVALPAPPPTSPGARFYEAVCAACHEPRNGLTTAAVRLQSSSKIAAGRADNLLRVIVDGYPGRAGVVTSAMPAFGGVLDDALLSDLAAYLRRRFQPALPPFDDLGASLGRVRSVSGRAPSASARNPVSTAPGSADRGR